MFVGHIILFTRFVMGSYQSKTICILSLLHIILTHVYAGMQPGATKQVTEVARTPSFTFLPTER
jgi:hypothetical protein